MIPLGLTERGSFFVGRKPSGRTVWVCKQSKCFTKFIRDPRKLFPKQKLPLPSRDTIRSILRDHLEMQANQQFCFAMRSGAIIHGSHSVKKCQTEKICMLLFSSDAGKKTVTEFQATHNRIESMVIKTSSNDIGKLLGRGPRSVLALRHSRTTQSLIDTLRAWHSLG